ncbi:hypothetical protein MRX96_020103 [Rhipicephalus microplus]
MRLYLLTARTVVQRDLLLRVVSRKYVIEHNAEGSAFWRWQLSVACRRRTKSPQLYPYATIEDFSFKVPNNRITNRELKVKMTRGEVRGLETALQRFGDCQVPLLRDEQTVIVCNLTMQGVNVTFSSLVDGDSLFSGWKTIWVELWVRNLTGTYSSTSRMTANLSLNKGRLEKFKHEIKAKVKKELYPMYSEYVSLLRRAVSLSAYPRA